MQPACRGTRPRRRLYSSRKVWQVLLHHRRTARRCRQAAKGQTQDTTFTNARHQMQDTNMTSYCFTWSSVDSIPMRSCSSRTVQQGLLQHARTVRRCNQVVNGQTQNIDMSIYFLTFFLCEFSLGFCDRPLKWFSYM